ncbi:MAG TPA: signal peptide peptidase SppA [Candidatus Polarisedimenticolia bacterium]|nr:signal peptide peptidase SppA [Candidatus Polarisedimenticolia bacterium]
MRTRNKWILGLLAMFALLILGLGLAVVALTSAPRVPDNSILVLDLSGQIPEEESLSVLERLLTGERKTVLDVVCMLRRAQEDSRVRAVWVRIGPLEEGWGKVQEMRDALVAYGRTGKPLVASLEFAGTLEYYLATGASRITMVPNGLLLLNGVAAQLPFVKGALDKLRIRADLEHIGEYKSASDMFTRDRASEAQLEATNGLLDSLYAQLVGGIAAGRKLSEGKTRQIVDRGILSAREGRQAGLVDELAYSDQVREELKRRIPGKVRDLDERSYLQVVRQSQSRGGRIALIYATGTLVSGRSSASEYGGRFAGSETVAEAIADARRDSGIKAIVLRVDSPGGSGIASDVIWRETQLARKKKPFIVSMSDLGASGGYWISMGADAIVAEPATVTGSIGVFAGKFDLGRFYNWIGVNWEILQRGRNADLLTDIHGFTEEQRSLLRGNLMEFYRAFIRQVASGRKMTEEEVNQVAQGRIWTGQQAKDRGLVDRLGGLDAALELARVKAGIPKSQALSIEIFPHRKGLLESLREGELGTTSAHSLPAPIRALAARAEISERLGREAVLLILPEMPIVH